MCRTLPAIIKGFLLQYRSKNILLGSIFFPPHFATEQCTVDMGHTTVHTLAATHPVDEEGLNELDNLQCDQKADGDQVVEQDDEGEEVEAKVSRPTIYHKTSFR